MSTSSYFLRQQQEKKTSPSSISVGSNALNSSPQETRNMTMSTKNNNNNQSNMSAYSPLQRSSVESIHTQDAEKQKNSYSPPARPSLNSRNNNGKINRVMPSAKKEISPLPIFNDKETHDIVVVAAGDRGLSGSHNKVLDKHVKRFNNNNNNNDPEHRDPLYMQGHETLASEKTSDDEFRFQMEFYCHRNVLSAGSYFFRSFFAARSEARQNSNSPSHSRNHFLNENGDDDDDECHRLVVHNVLPASLAHVIQSIYAAYANGIPEDPPLYDPIALSTAPISVIICAWELAMKLELRQVASNIVHILIPMISDENSLEVLKATTKYEHEQSVILQRACLHAKALPPKFRSRDKKELEEDKKLWQELCSQIPWLASTVVHLQDYVVGASNKKNQNRNNDHGVDNENETVEVSPQSTITANLSPHQRAEIKRKQHELDLALMKNNRGRQQNQIRKEKEDENDDEFEEDLQQLTKRALDKYSDAINVASSNPKNNSRRHDQQRNTQRNKRMDSSDDDDETQDGIMRNSRNNIEDDASSIGEATQQAWDDTASTVLGDDEDESEYRQNNRGKSKNKLTNMLNQQHEQNHQQIMNRHKQILLQHERNNNNNNKDLMTYQQQQQQPPIPIDQHVSLVMDRTIQDDDDDDDYDTSDENNHNRSIQKIENVYDAKDVMRLIGDDDDDDDDDYDDDDAREDEQDASRSNSKNDHEQHPLFSRLTPAVMSSVEALCVNNDRNEVATLVKNRQQQNPPPASTTSISLLHSKATTTHTTSNTGFIPSSSTKAANDDRMKMYHHHHQNQNQNSYSKNNNNNNTVSVLRETMARTSQMKIVKPVAFTPNNNNISTTTTTKTTKSSITPPNNGNGRSPCRGTTETSDVPFNSNININNNSSTSTPTSQRFADHSSPPNKNSNNTKHEQTHRFANQHQKNPTSSGIEKEIPDFEQKFLHSPSLLPQNNNNNNNNKQNQEEQEEEEEEVAAVVEMPIYGNATQQQQRQPPLVFDPKTLLDPFTAQHKLKIIDQEIQQTYDNYASEMQNYRIIYENLRRETTDLWGMTGFVDNGNVPSSIGIAEKILENFSRKFVEERHEREELSKAIKKIESHLEENNTFDETSDAFLRGAQLAARELEYIRDNLGQMVGDYLHFSPEKKKEMKNNNIDQNNEVKETVDEDDSQAASARLDAKQRSKRNTSLMKIRSLIEDQLDETVRRLIDEGREVEATMRVREITVEQLKDDLAHEIKKFEMAKSKIEKRMEKMK